MIKNNSLTLYDAVSGEVGGHEIFDMTRAVGDLIIRTNYRKRVPTATEVRDIETTGYELLEGSNFYSLGPRGNEGGVNIITNVTLKDHADVRKAILEEQGQIAVYIDTLTGTLSMSVSGPPGKTRHGVWECGHRETYNAIIITRAFAADLQNSVIEHPDELTDRYIKSHQILSTEYSGFKFITAHSSTITPEQLGILNGLGILSLDQYAQIITANETNIDFSRAIDVLLEDKYPPLNFYNLIEQTLADSFKAGFYYQNETSIVFTPRTLGITCDYADQTATSMMAMYGKIFSAKEARELMDILHAGKTISISIYALNKDGCIKLVCGWNHSDAINFSQRFGDITNLWLSEFDNVGEFNAALSVDRKSLEEQNRARLDYRCA